MDITCFKWLFWRSTDLLPGDRIYELRRKYEAFKSKGNCRDDSENAPPPPKQKKKNKKKHSAGVSYVLVHFSVVFWKTISAGSLSNGDDDGNENVISKYNFSFLQLFRDYSNLFQ